MADDWKPGDDALCVVAGRIICLDGLAIHGGEFSPPTGAVRRVVGVRPSSNFAGRIAPCGCIALHFADGSGGVSQRFTKLSGHTPDAEDAETIRLLTGTPTKQPA